MTGRTEKSLSSGMLLGKLLDPMLPQWLCAGVGVVLILIFGIEHSDIAIMFLLLICHTVYYILLSRSLSVQCRTKKPLLVFGGIIVVFWIYALYHILKIAQL